MRHVTGDLRRWLVLAQLFIDDLAQEIVFRPAEEFDLGDNFGSHLMDAAEHQRRAEAGRARRPHVERHLVDGQWLQTPPQARESRLIDAGADAAGS
jgi:hypothetical protein